MSETTLNPPSRLVEPLMRALSDVDDALVHQGGCHPIDLALKALHAWQAESIAIEGQLTVGKLIHLLSDHDPSLPVVVQGEHGHTPAVDVGTSHFVLEHPNQKWSVELIHPDDAEGLQATPCIVVEGMN